MPSRRLAELLTRLDARINWERRDRSAGMRQSLAPARDLMTLLGDPQTAFPCVHVTGSKGKGSVCALVAAGLREAGLLVGRYGSPHVETIHERFEIEGRPIDDEPLADALQAVLQVMPEAEAQRRPAGEASWFDLVTATALLAFRAAGVDWAVLEVGLGGRLDSTNVVHGEVCVVTSIGLEHTQVLGPTKEAIAAEKAGILKRESSFVCGVPRGAYGEDGPGPWPGRVLEQKAVELGIDPIWVPAATRGPLRGRNLALARAVLEELGRRGHRTRGSSPSPLHAGLLGDQALRSATLPGRMEWRRREGHTVLLDGAHTAESMAQVLAEGCEHQGGRLPRVVLSLARDKQLDAILKALQGKVDSLLCTALASGLHHTADDLCDRALELGLPAEAVSDPTEALQRALTDLPSDGWVLVSGSLYLVGAVRGTLDPPENP